MNDELSIPKCATTLTVVVALLIAMTASVAFAATISCPNRAGNLCIGTDGPDEMHGSLANDVIRSGLGNDVVIGGLGNDTIDSVEGIDRLEGRTGNDALRGGDDGDLILTGDGRDEAYGSEGNDTIRAVRDNEADFINCGAGSKDVADVQAEDYIDGQQAGTLVGTTVTSCEKVIVNGIVVIDRTQPNRL